MSRWRRTAPQRRMWWFQGPGDVAIGFASDEAVLEELAAAPASVHRTFGLSGADYRMVDHGANGAAGARLVGPGGVIASTGGMRRSLPHDVTNALAASALVLETGLATPEGTRRRSLPSWERHIASNWSGTTAPCATTTTPRRRRPHGR